MYLKALQVLNGEAESDSSPAESDADDDAAEEDSDVDDRTPAGARRQRND